MAWSLVITCRPGGNLKVNNYNHRFGAVGQKLTEGA